ncbi:hypothetical protein [Mycolicibacterium sarraceniae]|uniref:Uncharacterized protein n=1 Tax=Mycolicibacterium sarraceniae TaxID=1534348 RepID=A0A7I7SX18_9MYCO|nr:hypothetical protein [Mycolicibacterium sarraceniae]BBY61160.1 hypothetical protein MSAR_42960 [Mycolicibacterium sarraceniae]
MTDTGTADITAEDTTAGTETTADEVASEGATEDTTDSDANADGHQDDDTAETFPRAYVEKLRGQNAKYRDRAKVADTYAQRLHAELVRATGRLADPSDLEFDEDHLDDPDAMAAAVDDLLAAKPHLASRRPTGDIGQGNRGGASEPFSLLGLLKERT